MWEIFAIAIALAMDAFAVAISSGIILPRITARHYFRLSFHFGLFQGLMPILGWFTGKSVIPHLKQWDHWIAFLLLLYVGGKMIYESFRNGNTTSVNDPTRGMRLVMLSVATSIDALIIGFSLAILGVKIVLPALIIGLTTLLLTFAGMKLGEKLGRLFGRRIEILGGVILLAIGVKILLEHLR